jgi:hypothetical protein
MEAMSGNKDRKPVNLKVAGGLVLACIAYAGSWGLLGREYGAGIPSPVYWTMIWFGFVLFFTVIVVAALTLRDLLRWARNLSHQ